MVVLSRCSDCNHRNICKYKSEYDKVLEGIKVNIPEPFTLILNCKHYYSQTCYLNGGQYYGDTNSSSDYSNTGTLIKKLNPVNGDTFTYAR